MDSASTSRDASNGPSEAVMTISQAEDDDDDSDIEMSSDFNVSKDKSIDITIDQPLPENTAVTQPLTRENDESKSRLLIKKMRNDENYQIITCTACGQQVNHNVKVFLKQHPVLEVLLCRKCLGFYNSGVFTQDENGVDEYCRWCAEGGNLICCDFCHNAFCKECIRRNFGRKKLSDIMSLEVWHCFVCDRESTHDLREHCINIMAKQKRRKSKKSKKKLDKLFPSEDELDDVNEENINYYLLRTIYAADLLRERANSLLNQSKSKGTKISRLSLSKKLQKAVLLTKQNLSVIEKDMKTFDEKEKSKVNLSKSTTNKEKSSNEKEKSKVNLSKSNTNKENSSNEKWKVKQQDRQKDLKKRFSTSTPNIDSHEDDDDKMFQKSAKALQKNLRTYAKTKISGHDNSDAIQSLTNDDDMSNNKADLKNDDEEFGSKNGEDNLSCLHEDLNSLNDTDDAIGSSMIGETANKNCCGFTESVSGIEIDLANNDSFSTGNIKPRNEEIQKKSFHKTRNYDAESVEIPDGNYDIWSDGDNLNKLSERDEFSERDEGEVEEELMYDEEDKEEKVKCDEEDEEEKRKIIDTEEEEDKTKNTDIEEEEDKTKNIDTEEEEDKTKNIDTEEEEEKTKNIDIAEEKDKTKNIDTEEEEDKTKNINTEEKKEKTKYIDTEDEEEKTKDIYAEEEEDREIGDSEEADKEIGDSEEADKEIGDREEDREIGDSEEADKEIGDREEDREIGDSEVEDKEIGDCEVEDREIGDCEVEDREIGDSEVEDKEIGDTEEEDKEIGDSEVEDKEIGDSEEELGQKAKLCDKPDKKRNYKIVNEKAMSNDEDKVNVSDDEDKIESEKKDDFDTEELEMESSAGTVKVSNEDLNSDKEVVQSDQETPNKNSRKKFKKTKKKSLVIEKNVSDSDETSKIEKPIKIKIRNKKDKVENAESEELPDTPIKAEEVDKTDNESARDELLREFLSDSSPILTPTKKSPRSRPREKTTPKKVKTRGSSSESPEHKKISNRKQINTPLRLTGGGTSSDSNYSIDSDRESDGGPGNAAIENQGRSPDPNDEKLRMDVQVTLTRLECAVEEAEALEKTTKSTESNEGKKGKKGKRKRDSLSDSDIDKSIANLSNLKSLRAKKRIKVTKTDIDSGDIVKKTKIAKIKERLLSLSTDEDNEMDGDEEVSPVLENESIGLHVNEIAKKFLKDEFNSSENENDVENEDSDSDLDLKKKKDEKREKKTKTSQKEEEDGNENNADDSGNEANDESDSESVAPVKKKKKNDPLLNCKLTDSDSDKEAAESSNEKKRENKRKKRRIADSDESVVPSQSSNEESDPTDDSMSSLRLSSRRNKKDAADSDDSKKKTSKKRRRIKEVKDSSDAASGSDKESPTKTRKHIRKLIKDSKLHEDTKAAAREEEERRRRVADRQKLYNEVVTEEGKYAITTKLVLDKNLETNKELVQVHSSIIAKLKPHQVEGVKFLWETVCESVDRMKTHPGSGCILAHCMGLGKTLQVITFVHTLLSNQKHTKLKTCLVVCPLNTVLNWFSEFDMWLEDDKLKLDVYEIASVKNNWRRADMLQAWHQDGGVLIMGYDMFRNLVQEKSKRSNKRQKEIFLRTLINPGADVVVCDEGHILKNDNTALAKSMNRINTLRRVVLTGTPLQNNLSEYHCMVQFVKPNLLGTRKEFQNRFLNPIVNGQCADSTEHDVRLMKRRAHILHNLLDGCVQRRDYNVLTPFLPPKYEYVISIRLSEVQIKLYKHFLEHLARGKISGTKGSGLFADYQGLMKIWTHPYVLKLAEIRDENKAMYNSDDSFIDDESVESATSTDSEVLCLDEPSSSKGRGRGKKNKSESENSGDEVINNWRTRRRRGEKKEGDEEEKFVELKDFNGPSKEWWTEIVSEEDAEKNEASGKIVLLFDILQECEAIGDKVLVFSQSLLSLELIERTLALQEDGPTGSRWIKGVDYFRMDGSTSADMRKRCTEIFNDEESRVRLFLISTRAGGLGINLVSANRVVIFDASWNPTHDVQSIFRVYRFGQKKPVYIYRFLAQGSMEEKIYDRQITKLSLACRVVDEQQIERHFNAADLQELYNFEPDTKYRIATPIMPKDRLLTELLLRQKQWISGYHEHDSLLENKASEELTEEERKAAWAEYEAEKKGLMSAGLGLLPQGQVDINTIIEKIQEQWPGLAQEELNEKVDQVIVWLRQQAMQQRQQQIIEQQRYQQQYLQQQQQQYYQQQQQQNPQYYQQQQAALRQQQQMAMMNDQYRRSWMDRTPQSSQANPSVNQTPYLVDSDDSDETAVLPAKKGSGNLLHDKMSSLNLTD